MPWCVQVLKHLGEMAFNTVNNNSYNLQSKFAFTCLQQRGR